MGVEIPKTGNIIRGRSNMIQEELGKKHKMGGKFELWRKQNWEVNLNLNVNISL